MFELIDFNLFKKELTKKYKLVILESVKIITTTGTYIVPKTQKLLTTDGYELPDAGRILLRDNKYSVVLSRHEYGPSYFIEYNKKRFYKFWRVND